MFQSNMVAWLRVSWVVGCLLASGAFMPNWVRADKPNIVLIFIDDMGYGDIGPFGNQQFKTPHLDSLAGEGMKFTSFYATPVCSMSRACLMTGCYNVRVSIPGVLFPRSTIGLNPSEITLAEIVKQQGYATKCIGKWHLGHRQPFLPTQQGFDSYFGIPYSNDMTIDTEHARFAKDCVFREGMTEEKARAQAIRHTVPLMRGEEVVEYPADQATLTKRYTEEAIQFIQANQQQPFFLYLPHSMVHVPLAASDDFRGKSGQGLFGDAVEELDWSVGQIMQTLRNLKLDSKTLVIFTSDNGAASGSAAPWRGKKGSVFEGGVREPCIMRWPGHIPAGATCSQIAGNIDLLPTFAKLVGADLPKDRELDGRDISSLMFQADAPAVRDTHLYFNGAGALAAIRQGDWKLFLKLPAAKGKKAAVEPALYDLAHDPAETTDVSRQHGEVVARLRAEADKREREIREHRRPAGEIRGANVYLLGGQSNMQGIAKLAELPSDIPQTVPHAWFWNGSVFEPLVLSKTQISTRNGEFGPEVGFAVRMATAAHPVYLIKYAASGMPLHHGWNGNQWIGGSPQPNQRNFYPGQGGDDPNMGTLYRAMLTRFQAGIAHLKQTGEEPIVRGFLWMQGEQDAKEAESATAYAASLRRLRQRLIEDVQADQNLPMAFGQVLPFEPALPRFTHRTEVRASMAAADRDSGQSESIPNVKMISTDGFGLLPDTVHYDAAGQMRLGQAMAEAIGQLNLKP